MKDFFKPEDFSYAVTCDAKVVAGVANEKLNKLIESGELKYESSKQSGEDTGENKEIKNRMPRMVRIETWEW